MGFGWGITGDRHGAGSKGCGVGKKYLYGKYEYLGHFLDGAENVPENRGIRFCDIIHYKTMENEQVRDDESRRVFTLDKELFTIEINGEKIKSEDLQEHPTAELTVPRCYCLCLSHKQNDPVMFARFGADICIEVDTDVLIEFLVTLVSKRFPFRVLHGDINYFPSVMTVNPPIEEALIFHKDANLYSVEAEYRIALVLPETVHLISDGKKIEVLKGDEPSYLQIGHKEKSIWPLIFTDYYRLPGDLNSSPSTVSGSVE